MILGSRNRSILLGTALCALAGCGGGDAADAPASGAEGEEAAWVPPRDTDVLVAELTQAADGSWSIGAPVNVTQRPDYDNQPAFTPDGQGLLYTVNDPQSGQADIWRYDLGAETVTRVTATAPESEYSAAYTLDETAVTVIRVEADSTQRLWAIGVNDTGESPVFEDVAPVGYYAQTDATTYYMFVLGSPPTLVRNRTDVDDPTVLAENIGRSIHRIPGTSDVSFVQRHDDGSSSIMRILGGDASGTPAEITPAIADGDFHAWTPDGQVLMADGARIHAFDPDGAATWVEVADFSDLSISISRLAVSMDGSQIAIVAEPAMDLLPGD